MSKYPAKIGPLAQKHAHFILTLAKAKNSKQKCYKLFQTAKAEELLTVVEICLNILKNRIPLTEKTKEKLLKEADNIRKISRLRAEKSARKVFLQDGNGLPIAASIAASVIIPILTDYLSKHFFSNEIRKETGVSA